MKFKLFILITILCIILLCADLLFTMSSKKENNIHDRPLHSKKSKNADLVISGIIIKRKEIWDRRTNPMMGRPDILREILLDVQTEEVLKGKLPEKSRQITISIRGNKSVIRFKILRQGERGIFYLSGNKPPYSLLDYTFISKPKIIPAQNKVEKPKPKPKPKKKDQPTYDNYLEYTDKQISEMLKPPVKVTSKMIFTSKKIQKKVAKIIGARYKMKNAIVITMISHQGPRPPRGGYKYWGVKGKIKGEWYIWRPYSKGKLRKGTQLEDPQRFNKCNSPYTMISTPDGPVPIREIKPGDIVLNKYKKPVPVIKVCRVRAEGHMICRLKLDNGATLEISPGHPIADGQRINDLKEGDRIDGILIVKKEIIPYKYKYTYDILPDSRFGIYWANGVGLKSTLLDSYKNNKIKSNISP